VTTALATTGGGDAEGPGAAEPLAAADVTVLPPDADPDAEGTARTEADGAGAGWGEALHPAARPPVAARSRAHERTPHTYYALPPPDR